MEQIHLGGGCFWCIEGGLIGLRGVHASRTRPQRWTSKIQPYEQVCGKKTGHAEVLSSSIRRQYPE